ncbi:MAG: transglycosylase SLT domain-containing protein [Bryobacteraceae bacterium]|nr:transglycosylase SLT domain-containing protein [Bryobacteraceae bacterium]
MPLEGEAAATLVQLSGNRSGKRYRLGSLVNTVGRHPSSDVALDGDDARVVSTRHAEIRADGGAFHLHDLDSTNGTFVNNERVTIARLRNGDRVRFGASGPEFEFSAAEEVVALDRTMVVPAARVTRPDTGGDTLLTNAVKRARRLRRAGQHGQTTVIMRAMLARAVRRSARGHRRIIAVLTLALIAVSAYSYWRFQQLRTEKSSLDREIEAIEARLEKGGQSPGEIEALLARLTDYEARARGVQDSMFYKLGPEARQTPFIEREIRTLLEEFGADSYSIPPQFVEEVEKYIKHYQTVDRGVIKPVVDKYAKQFGVMQDIFRGQNLPPDLAYMVLIESNFVSRRVSSQGAAGLWQFTPETARSYGLRVNRNVDERYDLRKSTHAAGKFLRDLILDFGAGSSVMLALAAYNVGPSAVRQAVRRVEDPIKQRNFWYLYRVRALPLETRQYVPKIFAAIIIGRNLERFGF